MLISVENKMTEDNFIHMMKLQKSAGRGVRRLRENRSRCFTIKYDNSFAKEYRIKATVNYYHLYGDCVVKVALIGCDPMSLGSNPSFHPNFGM